MSVFHQSRSHSLSVFLRLSLPQKTQQVFKNAPLLLVRLLVERRRGAPVARVAAAASVVASSSSPPEVAAAAAITSAAVAAPSSVAVAAVAAASKAVAAASPEAAVAAAAPLAPRDGALDPRVAQRRAVQRRHGPLGRGALPVPHERGPERVLPDAASPGPAAGAAVGRPRELADAAVPLEDGLDGGLVELRAARDARDEELEGVGVASRGRDVAVRGRRRGAPGRVAAARRRRQRRRRALPRPSLLLPPRARGGCGGAAGGGGGGGGGPLRDPQGHGPVAPGPRVLAVELPLCPLRRVRVRQHDPRRPRGLGRLLGLPVDRDPHGRGAGGGGHQGGDGGLGSLLGDAGEDDDDRSGGRVEGALGALPPGGGGGGAVVAAALAALGARIATAAADSRCSCAGSGGDGGGGRLLVPLGAPTALLRCGFVAVVASLGLGLLGSRSRRSNSSSSSGSARCFFPGGGSGGGSGERRLGHGRRRSGVVVAASAAAVCVFDGDGDITFAAFSTAVCRVARVRASCSPGSISSCLCSFV